MHAAPGLHRSDEEAKRLWKEPGAAQLGHAVPNLPIEYAMRNTHVPVGPWRELPVRLA